MTDARHTSIPSNENVINEEGDMDEGEEEEENPFTRRRAATEKSFSNRTKSTKGRSQHSIVVDLSACKYNVVRDCAASVGWVESSKPGVSDDFTVFWTDLSVSNDRVLKLKNFQFINHFPGMSGICRKVPLARNLNRMKKIFQSDYSFFPQTWVLPFDVSAFKRYKFHEGRTFIIKPNSGSQGRGIILTRDRAEADKHGDCVVQTYIDRPFLIEDRKFDLRVYCLVLSVDPELRAFMFRDGLVRLCTEGYKAPSDHNINKACMHLTNYSLNKRNDHFVSNKENDFSSGSKRDFQFLNNFVASIGRDPTQIWADVADVLLKTIISITPQLRRQYRMCLGREKFNPYSCFEILGFDILLDYRLKPWLIEVNHSPSFNTDTPLDKHVKYGLITETMKLLCIDPRERSKYLRMERVRTRERIHGEVVIDSMTGSHENSSAAHRRQPLELHELIERQENMETNNLNNFTMIYPTQTFDLQKTIEQQMATLPKGADVHVRTIDPYNVVERYRPFMEQSKRIASFGTDNHVQRLYPTRSPNLGNGGSGARKKSPIDETAVVIDTAHRTSSAMSSKYANVQSRYMDYEKRARVQGGEDETTENENEGTSPIMGTSSNLTQSDEIDKNKPRSRNRISLSHIAAARRRNDYNGRIPVPMNFVEPELKVNTAHQ